MVINKGRSSTQKNVEVEVVRKNCEITIETRPTTVLVNPQEEVSSHRGSMQIRVHVFERILKPQYCPICLINDTNV